MSHQFQGEGSLDDCGSAPDWAPLHPQRARTGAPNEVCIVLDDGGLAATNRYAISSYAISSYAISSCAISSFGGKQLWR